MDSSLPERSRFGCSSKRGPATFLRLEGVESRFPITLDAFAPAQHPEAHAPLSVWRSIHANGQQYRAIAWIAPDADERLRSQLAEVVASLSFPPLSPGAVVGIGFTVLEPEDRYPVGSFTSIRADDVPLMLVRAPGGFYALGWNWLRSSGQLQYRPAITSSTRLATKRSAAQPARLAGTASAG